MYNQYEKLPDEPILIGTFLRTNQNEAFTDEDATLSLQELLNVLDLLEEPVIYIHDWQQIDVDFNQTVAALAFVARGENAPFKHHNIKEFVTVTTSDMVALAGNALGQEQYTGRPASVFTTVDEALVYVRKNLLSKPDSQDNFQLFLT